MLARGRTPTSRLNPDRPSSQHKNESRGVDPMKRFILTGTPGAGKTAILRQLEIEGFGVVEEAATDVIALWQARGIREAWKDPLFIDAIVDLQIRRQTRAADHDSGFQFHDRSVVCTVALARYLGYPPSQLLERELGRVMREATFERAVFFVRNLGFVSPTQARRISFEGSLRFEQIHEEVYREYGFHLIDVAPGSLAERVARVRQVDQVVSEKIPSLYST